MQPKKVFNGHESPYGSPEPQLMDVAECAHFLRVQPQTIYKLTRNGKLPVIRAGGRLRFSRAQIERMSNEGAFTGEK
jgi:excisionase family DNA binding protein